MNDEYICINLYKENGLHTLCTTGGEGEYQIEQKNTIKIKI